MSIEDDSLQHSGIRGGRSWCLCTLVFVLFLVAVLNALVTAGLVYFLSISHIGMEFIELAQEGDYVRVLTNLEVENLTLRGDIIQITLKDMDFVGHKVSFRVHEGSQVGVGEDEIRLLSSEFKLKLASGRSVFSTSDELSLDMYRVKNLHAPFVEVGSVSSCSMFPDLFIESFHDTEVFGMEGVQVEAEGNVDIHSRDGDIVIHSLHGALEFFQEDGMFLDPDLPVEGKGSFFSSAGSQYKVCVCGSSGKVFVVPDEGPGRGCHLANEKNNPCLD